MSYVSLYRKYRSQTFEDVVGQDHVTRTLQNAISSGRISHAYLFCGSRGTGKTTVARLVAKSLNCVNGPTPNPCNECDACISINEGSAVDVIELDAASHRGIDDIKEIRDNVKYPPMHLRYKVFVIDEAHQLSDAAKDAFLKTLEEPPPHGVFILATTEAHEIPLTIRSRCQQFDFRRGSVMDITGRIRHVLKGEGREADDAAVEMLAKNARGSWRDALSLLEQILAYTDDRITVEHVGTVLGMVDEDVLYAVSEVVAGGDAAAAFELAERIVREGKDIRELVRAICGHFRDLYAASVGAGVEVSAKAVERARRFTGERLLSLVELFAAAEKDLRWNDQHHLALEMALLRATCGPAQAVVSPIKPAPPSQPVSTTAAAKPTAQAVGSSAPSTGLRSEEFQLSSDGELTLERAGKAWPLVMKHINDVQHKRLLIGALKEAKVVSVEGDSLCLGFNPRLKFHMQKFQEPSNIEPIEIAFEAVLGKKVKVKITALQPVEQSLPVVEEAVSDTPPLPDDDDMVQEVLDMFPGSKVVGESGPPGVDIDDEEYDPWKES